MILTIKNETFFFIHIPKCGGTSISESLSKKENNFYQFNGFRHNSISEDLNHIEEKKLNIKLEDAFVFASVRNPWDRMVSVYHFHKILNDGYPLAEICKKKSFSDFIKYTKDNYTNKNLFSIKTYEDFILTNKEMCVDYFIDFNKISEDFTFVANLFKKKCGLLKINQTKHKEYAHYYDSTNEDIVRKIFKFDIELFNYSFENPKQFKKPEPNWNKIKKLFSKKIKIL